MTKRTLIGTAVLMTLTLFGRVSAQTNTALQARLGPIHTLTAEELKIIMPPAPQPRPTITNRVARSAAALAAGASLLAQQSGSAHPMDLTQTPPTYNVIDLGDLGEGISTATGIDNNGHVVGYSLSNNTPYHMFLYSNGSMQDLGGLGSATFATGISDNGLVTGYGYSSAGATSPHPLLYSNGSMQDLGIMSPADPDGYATGINDSGQVAGYSVPRGGNFYAAHAFLYSNGLIRDLNSLLSNSNAALAFAVANGINNAGQIVGWGGNPPLTYQPHAFLYSNGSRQDLGTLPGSLDSYAYGINNNGQVVGQSGSHAFLYSNGSMQDLGLMPGANVSRALGVNNNGHIVGTTYNSGVNAGAFLYWNGSMYNLNTLLFNANSGWTLQTAVAINDAGQIAGNGINPAGQTHAFLLNPLPIGSVTAASTVQTNLPTYNTIPAPQAGKGLIFITHGTIASDTELAQAVSFVNSTSNAVVQYLNNHGLEDQWQVYGYLWTNKVFQAYVYLPPLALYNAEQIGKKVGNSIVAQESVSGLTRIHFIAHSAGAGMIQQATEVIKASLGEAISIHCTFLDAYDGYFGEKAYEYGTGADWADSYFVRGDDFQRSGWTGRILPNAYNVDVTALDQNATTNLVFVTTAGSTCDTLESDHGWPTEFYTNSVDLSSVSNASYYGGFGFPLSEEAGNWEFATNQYPVGNGLTYGSVMQLGPDNGTCIPPYILPPFYIGSVPRFSVASTIQSITGTLQKFIGSIISGTGSPVWVATVITDTNALNYVSFDAEFTSAAGADGLLTVYWDTNMIGVVEEAAVQPGLRQYAFAFPNAAPNTSHVLGFHVDPFTSTHSTLVLTNIVTGAVGVSQPFTLSVTTNTSNGLLVYQLNGQPGYYTVQSSADFINWTNIALLANTNGTVLFVDPNSTNYPSRFYRATAPTGLSE